MGKRFAQIFFILLTVLALFYFDAVLCVRSKHGVNQTRAFYAQPKNTMDVVFMGTSHIHCDIDPAVLWQNYGIASYDYSAAEQPLWITYYYLQELLKTQSPQVIVLDLYGPGRFKDDYQYKWLPENLCGMRFSLNKLRVLSVSAERDRLEDFFPSFATYHDRILSMTTEDFLFPFSAHREFRRFKGFTPYLPGDRQDRPDLDGDETGGLTDKSAAYLEKIVDYTKEKDLSLYLIVSPYAEVYRDEPVYRQIEGLAAEYGIPFTNFNHLYDEIGLDFEGEDFYDESHLSYWGACKYTDFLGQMLIERYDLPDHRDDPGYESWQDNVGLVEETIREKS
ncbi:MAG: DUF1574 domain-containing protein [Lachnospiraceae bacterium]|nr:DUF1574 domain-containing protein [Lachnospiraceae bacterium]